MVWGGGVVIWGQFPPVHPDVGVTDKSPPDTILVRL
jgi:hypothetical protein